MTGQPQSTSIHSRIRRRIKRWGPGRVFVTRDLLDLGSRSAVDVAIHRLLAADDIRRLGRGIYDVPRVHERFGLLTPTPDDLAHAVARRTGESLVTSGAMAANLLGLSTQVPARPFYLTNGTTRELPAGSVVLRFKHTAPAHMVGGDSKAGMVLRALRFLGADGLDRRAVSHLRRTLSDLDRSQLRKLRPVIVSWMQAIVDTITEGAGEASPLPGHPTAGGPR